MPTKLVFPLRKVKLREDIEKKMKDAFGIGFGEVFYPIVRVRFKRIDGTWTEKLFTLIFDTGASITLLPAEMADFLGLMKFVEHEMTGVVRKEECRLPVNMSRVRIRLEDDRGNISPELEIWAAVSRIEETPFLLGMKNLIDQFRVTVDPVRKELQLTTMGEDDTTSTLSLSQPSASMDWSVEEDEGVTSG